MNELNETITVNIDEGVLAELRQRATASKQKPSELVALSVWSEVRSIRPVHPQNDEDEPPQEMDEEALEFYYRDVHSKPPSQLTDEDLDFLRAERLIKKYLVDRS